MAHSPIALRRRTAIALEAADALTARAVARDNVRRGSVSVLGRENVERAYRAVPASECTYFGYGQISVPNVLNVVKKDSLVFGGYFRKFSVLQGMTTSKQPSFEMKCNLENLSTT